MHETLKSSPAGKFMLHKRDSRRSREFLCVVPQTPVPMYMRKRIVGTWVTHTLRTSNHTVKSVCNEP